MGPALIGAEAGGAMADVAPSDERLDGAPRGERARMAPGDSRLVDVLPGAAFHGHPPPVELRGHVPF